MPGSHAKEERDLAAKEGILCRDYMNIIICYLGVWWKILELVYYLAWVIQFYPFCDKSPGKDVSVELKGRLVTSKETIRRFQPEPSSNVSKSLRALCSKGILRREKGAYVFEDVLFSRWIEKINR